MIPMLNRNAIGGLWRSYRTLQSPSLYANSKSAFCDSDATRPFSKAMSLAVIGKQPDFSRVLSLFQFCSPAAISRLVIAVIVNAINCCFRKRLRPHVLKEVNKRIEPSLTNSYSSTAIDFVVGSLWVVAPPLHFLPGRVLARLAHSVSVSAMATARLGGSFAEFATSHSGNVSAFTVAVPARIARLSLASVTKNSQFSVDFASLVFSAGRQLDRIIRRHDSTLLKVGL